MLRSLCAPLSSTERHNEPSAQKASEKEKKERTQEKSTESEGVRDVQEVMVL